MRIDHPVTFEAGISINYRGNNSLENFRELVVTLWHFILEKRLRAGLGLHTQYKNHDARAQGFSSEPHQLIVPWINVGSVLLAGMGSLRHQHALLRQKRQEGKCLVSPLGSPVLNCER